MLSIGSGDDRARDNKAIGETSVNTPAAQLLRGNTIVFNYNNDGKERTYNNVKGGYDLNRIIQQSFIYKESFGRKLGIDIGIT